MKKLLPFILVILFAGKSFSQDTLPRFTLQERGNRVIISWSNPYSNLIQLNVQRSLDSLKYFTTIFSPTAPGLATNGYTDAKLPTNRVYYRIFYVLEGGTYFFTKSKRAGGTPPDASDDVAPDNTNTSRDQVSVSLRNATAFDKRIVTIKIRDSVYKQLSINAFRNFRDSILRQTKDTIFSVNDTLVGLSPFVAKEIYRTSSYIYVNRDGFINISLPSVGDKKYNIKFFEENGSGLFEVHNVKESPLIIDKANFIHAGWFTFELYEDNKLKEKNKFYIPKDF